MQLSKPNAVPKPKSVSRQAKDGRLARAFREAVWKRDGFKNGLGTYSGYCARCGKLVCQGDGGQIDHIKPRSTHPELKYDPANARIVCAADNLYYKLHPTEREP